MSGRVMVGLIVHEWVAKAGGSENVVDEFIRTFPESDMQVLWSDDPERFPVQVYETWLARTPIRRSKVLALPFLPVTWRTLNAHKDYDWVLTSSHLFAHHARPRGLADVPKYSYVHTPARYIWEPGLDPRGNNPLVRIAGNVFKPIDKKRAQESSLMAANSEFTRDRIHRAWERDAEVIYPPVNTERIRSGGDWRNSLTGEELRALESLPQDFLLGAARFVSYKRLDLVISAGEACDLPVVLAGGGPEEDVLRGRAARARVPVTFIPTPSDALLYALYQRAMAYVFPAIEDFGIMPVEAMACGTPVVVPSIGGASESVRLVDGGAVYDEATPHGFRDALQKAMSVNRAGLPDRTQVFSATRFRNEIREWVETALATPSKEVA